jgi:hypothetical protein
MPRLSLLEFDRGISSITDIMVILLWLGSWNLVCKRKLCVLWHICLKQDLWDRETGVASERRWNNIHFWATVTKQAMEQRPLLGSKFLIRIDGRC